MTRIPAFEMHYPVAGLRVYETPEIEAELDAGANSNESNPAFRQATRDYYRYTHAEYRVIKALRLLWELDPAAAEPILDELGIEVRWRTHDEIGNPVEDEFVGWTEEEHDAE